MDTSDLYNEVTSAFSSVPYPGDENIGHPDGRDDGEMVADWFRGRDWRLLKPSELWAPSLGFMTPEAFHYYFPAFLLAAREVEAGDVYDNLLSLLTPPDQKDYFQPSQLFQSRYRNFTPDQKRVVRKFIETVLQDEISWYGEYGDSITAASVAALRELKEYWNQF